MKSFSAAAMAAIEAGEALDGGAVAILCDPSVFVWSGDGVLPLPVEGVTRQFDGIGDRGLARLSGAAIGGTAQKLTLSLSGIDPAVLELIEAGELRDAPVIVWRLIFDATGTQLLDAQVFRRGRVDQLTTEEELGGTATITLAVEGAARGLGRRGARMRTDADQRLIDANDGGMKRVSFAGEKVLYWGGQKPASAGGALPGATWAGAFVPGIGRLASN